MKTAIASLVSHGDDFLSGAAALGMSLNHNAPSVDHVLLVEDGQYRDDQIQWMERIGWKPVIVPPIRSQPAEFMAERWPYTFTKLHVFNQTDYKTILYMDADCCTHRNDFLWLLNWERSSIGACTVSQESIKRFNAGVLVLHPDAEMFADMHEKITTWPGEKSGAKFADQGFLNVYFDSFERIADRYNTRRWDRPRPNVAISHLRPHPWTTKPKKLAMRPYLEEWKTFYRQAEEV